jgi:hypothetical protein
MFEFLSESKGIFGTGFHTQAAECAHSEVINVFVDNPFLFAILAINSDLKLLQWNHSGNLIHRSRNQCSDAGYYSSCGMMTSPLNRSNILSVFLFSGYCCVTICPGLKKYFP